jgi:hypothetical protein
VSNAGASARRDAVLALAMFAGALAWFAVQPHNLGAADESYLLADVIRMRQGDRLYEDIFWLAMPGAHWALQAVFAVFGASLATAKAAMAVANAATAAFSVACARALRVRPALALVPGLAFLALAQPAWPHVSPHWFDTTLIMAAMWLAVRRGGLEQPRRLFAIGLLIGGVAAVHQHVAPPLAVGMAVAAIIASRVRRDAPGPAWWVRVAWIAAGTLLIVVPVLAILLATVDPQRLLDDTVRFPLINYRAVHDITWGQVGAMNVRLAPYTWPAVLRFGPLALPLAAAIVTAGCRRGWPRRRVVQWSAALLVCASALAAIGYNADFIHIAFMAPPVFVVATLVIDAAVDALAPRRRLVGCAVAAVLMAVLGRHMAGNAYRMRAEYRLATATAFGRVDFSKRWEVAILTAVRQWLDRSPTRELFVYPVYASLYVTTGAHNPTRHQILLPDLSPPQYYEETQAALAAHRPLVVVMTGLLAPDDPFLASLDPHYEVAQVLGGWTIYRWRDEAPPG